MAVLLVLSIAGIFHRAWHLHSSKHKSVFYRDNAAFALIRAHLLPLTKSTRNGKYALVHPIAGILVESCICLLKINLTR